MTSSWWWFLGMLFGFSLRGILDRLFDWLRSL